MSEIRTAFVHHVLTLKTPVAAACRQFGIRRQTGHKWLARYRHEPTRPLVDHSRRPHTSPARTAEAIATAILAVRDQFGGGPRTIHAYLSAQGQTPPSARTVSAILQRHGRVALPPADPPAIHFFKHAQPNERTRPARPGPTSSGLMDPCRFPCPPLDTRICPKRCLVPAPACSLARRVVS